MDTIQDLYARETSGPKYRALASAIRQAVTGGAMAPGDRLPPVRDLAWRLQITPGTVARAYTILTDEGALVAEVGRGTFVAAAAEPTRPLTGIEVDAVRHNQGGDTHEVNLVSPHLPDVGQVALIRALLAQIAQDPPSGVMHYPGHASGRAARQAVVGYLADTMLARLDAEDIVLAHGAQNAVMMVMQAVLTGRRPVVLVEELAYPGYRRAADLLRADVVPVPMDAHGVIPEALEAIARQHQAQLLCLSAEVQNPLLMAMPTERREAVAEIARRTDLQIVEDDCYRIGPPSGPSFRALAPERGWYVASISKRLTPALRFGFAVAPEGRAAALRRTAEGGFFGLATPITDLAAALLTHPRLPALQQALRETVADHVRAIVNALGRYDLKWREDALYVWLNLPPGWRASAFARAAEAQGVQIRTAEDYADRNANTPHAVRIAVNAGVSRRSFDAALDRLRHLLDNPPERIAV
ncbi:PLP-dependent aminotransferase family protein [Thalassococcus sp. CAU 1522]|uniref:PLP-dependent aminotransferase family protein n=1 Tax=Thalassococcus arenae TaxID=2851652 RepID=A0ABS6NAQ9_9RHOB|nr:PLP-dependent aminotransferase family protein [Thalassococcus arenae]MBV2361107.1 PLP-dependent aminotransferase family protein [Thalassococcus arenae]